MYSRFVGQSIVLLVAWAPSCARVQLVKPADPQRFEVTTPPTMSACFAPDDPSS
ncbi:hypothetical protein PF005_g18818 [Phytophthora fragariae]|uniref:RxLR effector protein n=1 Tax=Phytophthora fragariae TaxID=53985 RepID=A0A6A3J915_9STRA|nr:hypothetical protein PF003_g32900 [Phytophthora fragariae]KAE8930192.1 hypothetical protein PF009_g19709 [Phytophthora fragariae]KAE8991011.1 hypothetical protein PF011_g18111 [Phytophthora fragariae]KAE9091346.1 hypothetical protein PF010_g18219 [Phytophthora fragariae]KAE9091399.1 hypothetical protein PF007_g18893 [Phytophthora fragariae]